MFFPRLIYPELLSHLRKPEATIVTGMRRTGKTMLLERLFEEAQTSNKAFIDLEKRFNREVFDNSDYDEILKNIVLQNKLNPKEKIYLFLDEIQTIKNLPSVMKYLFDHFGVKFIVTGSSSFYLRNLFSESMAGRKQLFELYPLTFNEFLFFKGSIKQLPEMTMDISHIKKSDWWQEAYDNLYLEYLLYGGFPGVVLVNDEVDKKRILKEVLFSYIDQDVKNLSTFKKIGEMEKMIRLLASRIGQKIDLAKISREVGLARETVEEYLYFLEQTFMIFTISPFSKSPDREISKAKKLYFCDTGLANVLSPISTGQALENAIFHSFQVRIPKKFAFLGINYYQKKGGTEIDFILNEEIGVEVKETVDIYDFKRLGSLADKINLKKVKLISMNKTSEMNAIYASQI